MTSESGSSARAVSTDEYDCPNCGARLQRTTADHGVFWECPSCGGRALSVGLLRQRLEPKFMDALWQGLGDSGSGDRKCPSCTGSMSQITIARDGGHLQLDVCRRCHFVWFDAKEFESSPPAPPVAEAKPPELPPRIKELMGIYQSEEIGKRMHALDHDPLRAAESGTDWMLTVQWFYDLLRHRL